MHFIYYKDKMLSYNEVKNNFDQFFDNNLPFPKYPNGLYEPCFYILEDSGKRIRPTLCLVAAQLFNENIHQDAYQVAMALELFHNFTLVHDDIMDNAPLRRGKQTLHNKYGLTTGILSGDVMNIFSYKCLAEVRTELIKPLFDLFNTTAIEVCEGQQLDMDYEVASNVSIDDYLNMIRLKTSVLLACSLKSGGIIAKTSDRNAEKLYELGINLGTAFQIQDDYLDTFGESKTIGKAIGSDIYSNKKTFLLLKAHEVAEGEDKAQLTQLLDRNDEGKIPATIELFKKLGIDVVTKDLINIYFDKVMSNFNELDAPEENKKPLLDIINLIIKRQN